MRSICLLMGLATVGGLACSGNALSGGGPGGINGARGGHPGGGGAGAGAGDAGNFDGSAQTGAGGSGAGGSGTGAGGVVNHDGGVQAGAGGSNAVRGKDTLLFGGLPIVPGGAMAEGDFNRDGKPAGAARRDG